MLNVKPFLVRFARSAVPEPSIPEDGPQARGNMPDPPPHQTPFSPESTPKPRTTTNDQGVRKQDVDNTIPD